jgi:hypothetical protein
MEIITRQNIEGQINPLGLTPFAGLHVPIRGLQFTTANGFSRLVANETSEKLS